MKKLKYVLYFGLLTLIANIPGQPALGADQTVPGAGNAAAVTLSSKSPMVQSAKEFLVGRINSIGNSGIRAITLDAVANPATCVAHRAGLQDADKSAILQALVAAGLVDTRDDSTFPGGLRAGLFPPLLNDGSPCPQMPQTFFSAPGSFFGGHHSWPGGLAVHESFNDVSSLNLANGYRKVYGHSKGGLPVIDMTNAFPLVSGMPADIFLSEDLMIAAPIWHDWAKPMVFQWNSDGTEFKELSFGGNGVTDNFGAPGNSKTGGHHILSIAEAMKRGLPPDLVIAQATAHSHTTATNEYNVVNWLHAAAIIAQIDPVVAGYLSLDAQGRLRLPPLRRLGDVNLNAATPSQSNLLVEYPLHAVSDSDFVATEPAVSVDQVILMTLAPEFGFDPGQTGAYNNGFRNPVFSFMTAERLFILYGNSGLDAVRAEIAYLRKLGVI
ncbi:MAG TPA: hypothetical protein VJN89_14025 [Candidatus Acidoferrum sp.]|nr:hypothetical protein [Candidatus Acidoferrum sp.]